MKTFLTALIISFACLPVFAADGEFELNYRKANRWVAQDDIKDLRDLLKESKKRSITHFYVRIPDGKRGLTIDRLVVLRDILEKSLKHSIVIEEIPGAADANQIIIMFEGAAKDTIAPMATPTVQTKEISN